MDERHFLGNSLQKEGGGCKKSSKRGRRREKVFKKKAGAGKSRQKEVGGEKKSSKRCRSDPNMILIEVLKMVENDEKPCLTFFAFLPPYFGVSGSLVSRNR